MTNKINRATWESENDDQLYIDFLNTSKSEYIDYEHYLDSKWSDIDDRLYDFEIEQYEQDKLYGAI